MPANSEKRYILCVLFSISILSSMFSQTSGGSDQQKFLTTRQKIALYNITDMLYHEEPMDSIINTWLVYLGNEKKINLQKAGSYIFRRFGDYLVRDIRFIKKRIARLKKFRKNLTDQIKRKDELAFLKDVVEDLETRIRQIDEDLAHEDRKLTGLFNRNEKKMAFLDTFFKRFRLSSRPIWRHMRELYPGYYFRNPYDDYILEPDD